MLPAQRRKVLQQAVINGLPMAVQCFRGPLQEPYSIKQWTSQQDKFRINLVHQMPRLNTSLPIWQYGEAFWQFVGPRLALGNSWHRQVPAP